MATCGIRNSNGIFNGFVIGQINQMVYNLYDKLVLNDHKKSAIDLDVFRSQGEALITN